MKKLLALILVPALLSACVVVPEVPYGGVVVRDGGPPFCPPGQAKKGRC